MDNQYLNWDDAESRRRLTRIALAVLDSPVLAEEIVQEAYLRLLENEAGAVESPSAWLKKVTRNLAIDHARRRMRERELLRLVPGQDLSEQHTSRHETESRLAEMVSCLLHVSDAHVTAIVLLHVVFGMNYEDIASICRRSPAACRQAGSRALRKCLNVLDADEPYDEAANTDMYVHAILDASTAPLIDSLSVTSPVSMQGISTYHVSGCCDNSSSNTYRTRQVLVLTTTGVQWALVLDGMVLCLPDSTMHSSSVTESDITRACNSTV